MLLRASAADAEAQLPAKVFLKGRLTFVEAARNVTRRKGLFMEVEPWGHVLLELLVQNPHAS